MAALIDLVRSPEGATSGQIRSLGLKGAGLGLVLFVPGLLLFLLAHDWMIETFGVRVGDFVRLPRVATLEIGGPMTAGYVLLIIGLQRIVLGAAAHSKSPLVGVVRLLFGIVATMGMSVVAILIFITLAP